MVHRDSRSLHVVDCGVRRSIQGGAKNKNKAEAIKRTEVIPHSLTCVIYCDNNCEDKQATRCYLWPVEISEGFLLPICGKEGLV